MKDFPLYRSAQACAVGTLVIAGPLLLLSLSPLSGMYAVLLVFFLLPAALCMAGLMAGALPMALGAAAGLVSMYMLAGRWGLILTAVYLLPIVAAFVAVIALRVLFWKSCAVMVGVHVLSLAAVYLLMQRLAGGDLYTWAGERAAYALENWEMGDAMLYQMYSMGLLGLPDELAQNAVLPALGGYVLSDAARQDLLLSVNTLVSSALITLIPSLIVSQSILGGVGCLLLPLRFGYLAQERREFLAQGRAETEGEHEKSKVDFPDLGMPPFSLWHIPRGKGWQVVAALAAGYILRVNGSLPLAIAGVILYAASSSVLMIQGAALVNYLQKMRGTRRFWRVLLPLILMAASLLVFVGIFDQISNVRRLRKPRQPKEDDLE